MADTRTVVLALSPRASEILDRYLTDARDNIAVEVASGDEAFALDAEILDTVIAELNSQRGTLPPATAQQVAEQMAKAAGEAVAA